MSRQPNSIIELINGIYGQLPNHNQLGDPVATQKVLDLARQRVELERALELSEGTKKRYAEVGIRLIQRDQGEHLRDLCQTDLPAGQIIERFVSKTNSAGVCRGAIRHTIAKQHFTKVLGGVECGSVAAERAAAIIYQLFQGLRKVEPLTRDSGTSWFIGDGRGRKEQNSKRRDVPSDPFWREKTWSLVDRNDSRYKLALAVIDYTGIRPEELVQRKDPDTGELVGGVKVSLEPGDQGSAVLIFDIITAKRTDGATRTLVAQIGPDGGPGRFLAAQIRDAGEVITVSLDSTAIKTFSGRIRIWGATFGWKISCYSYRHAMADDLRSLGDPRLFAIALGHKSTASARHYGATAGGRGCRRPRRNLLINALTNIEPTIIERPFQEMGKAGNVPAAADEDEDTPTPSKR